MMKKIRILFLSANPWTTSRILVDEEAREIFEKLSEGQHGDQFELVKHTAIRPSDLQRLLMLYRPDIVHFSGHGSKAHRIIFEGAPGRGKQVDPQGLVDVFRLYRDHVRLVLLNSCFTKTQAQALTEVIDYSVGISRMIGDRAGVTFAGAFYRALGFGKPVAAAFESAQAELRLTKMPRSKGIKLFIRRGLGEGDRFPCADTDYLGANGDSLRVALKLLLDADAGPGALADWLENGSLARAPSTLPDGEPNLPAELAECGHESGVNESLTKFTLQEVVIKLAALLLHRRALLLNDC